MNCREVPFLLQAYLDGELEGERARDVTSHLRTCPACRRECEARQDLLGGLSQALAEEAQAPTRLRDGVVRQLTQDSLPDHRTAAVAGPAPRPAS